MPWIHGTFSVLRIVRGYGERSDYEMTLLALRDFFARQRIWEGWRETIGEKGFNGGGEALGLIRSGVESWWTLLPSPTSPSFYHYHDSSTLLVKL